MFWQLTRSLSLEIGLNYLLFRIFGDPMLVSRSFGCGGLLANLGAMVVARLYWSLLVVVVDSNY